MTERKTVAVLIDHLDPMVGGYAGQLRAAFDAECRKLDYDLFIVVGRSLGGPGPAEVAQNSVYDLITEQSVDGVILVTGGLSAFSGAEHVAKFCERFRPMPVCSVGLTLPGIPSIVIDPRPGLWDLVDHLVRVHGCSRIAYIGGPALNPEAQQRFQAFNECLARHGRQLEPELAEEGPFTLAGGSEATLRILSRTSPPQAIVSANDAIALGVIKALQGQGLRVPRDVIVTGFDDLAFARLSSPPLTTIRQPLARMAALAVRSIHAQLQGIRSSRSTELPVELTVRDSCGCGERDVDALPTSSRVVMHPADYLDAQAQRIHTEISNVVELPEKFGTSFADRLIAALKRELGGERGAFTQCLDELLGSVDADLPVYDEWQKLVTRMREGLSAVSSPMLESIWHAARRSIARANSQRHARLRQDLDLVYQHLLYTGERFASATDLGELREIMSRDLPLANVKDALVLLYVDENRQQLAPFFCLNDGVAVPLEPLPFPAVRLFPEGAPRASERTTAFVLPLTFGPDALGVAIFGARSGVHEMLRMQISLALRMVGMNQNASVKSPSRVPAKAIDRLNQLSKLLTTVARDLETAATELGAVGSQERK